MRVPVRLAWVAPIAILIVAVVSPVFVSAQNAASPGEYKIGVVDRKAVFDNYEKQQQEYERLQQEMSAMQAEIDQLSERIEQGQQRLQQGLTTLTPEEQDELELSLTRDISQYQTDYQRLQREVDARFSRLVRRIRDEIDEVVQEIGAQENFHLILEGDPRSQSGVLYFSSTIDLTSRVLAALEAR